MNKPVLRGRDVRVPMFADVDVVIVGSGAGGAVVAHELARDGKSVLVIEEGGHYPQEEYGKLAPSQSVRRIAREAGLSTAIGLGETPLISVLAGKVVGGSSVLTGGVIYRIPNDVLHEWSHDLGLDRMSPEALDPFFSEVEEKLHVETVPVEMRSRSTEIFAEGAAKLGMPMKSLRRNTQGCKGASRCTFGCPNGAKMSVDISWLPGAYDAGARVWSDALVERVEIAGGVARGVRGRFLGLDGEPSVPFVVRAKVVVVACGSMHTPVLLRKSGLGSVDIGRHLTLHPGFRVCAIMDERVDGWDGAMQSAFCDTLLHEGLIFNSVYSAASILAAGFPGFGKKHGRVVRSLPNLAVFGGMVHDEGGGRVHRWLSREPLVTYRMSERDRGRMWKGIQVLGRMAFAAGAKEVILPIFGSEPIKSESALDALTSTPPSTRKVECMAFHPLGTARMSKDRSAGVVKPSGESWEVDNLIVADGSVLPTSIGVNSQLPIMTVALTIARGLMTDWRSYARRAA